MGAQAGGDAWIAWVIGLALVVVPITITSAMMLPCIALGWVVDDLRGGQNLRSGFACRDRVDSVGRALRLGIRGISVITGMSGITGITGMSGTTGTGDRPVDKDAALPATCVFTLEANIGAGKSTLLRALAAGGGTAQGAWRSVATLPEPVDRWTRPLPGSSTSMLEHFYRSPSRNAAAFQGHVLQSRLDQLLDLKANAAGAPPALVSERSVWSDHAIFGALMRDDGNFSDVDWHVYCGWKDTATRVAAAHGFGLGGVVYLRTSPDVCHERLTRRARAGEQTITLEYLRRVHAVHEDWTATCTAAGVPLLVLDGDDEWNHAALAEAVVAWLRRQGAAV
jgi:deoxyadenosine/deoxycytidine kinase